MNNSIPVLSWLPSYNLELFGGDLIAGVTVSSILVAG
jgi:MFS superfamily sulfate permease-like transporter